MAVRPDPYTLLDIRDSVVPPAVLRTCEWFENLGIWCLVGRNSPATSCADAAHRRSRLGVTGIPLSDELKTLVLAGDRGRIAMAHCRADNDLDLEAVSESLGFEVWSANADILSELGLGYGLANPFALPDRILTHVFDSRVINRVGVPGTLMTNAGDLTWSVEFFGDDLVAAMHSASVAKVAVPTQRPPANKEIGILGGEGPDVGLRLWQLILESTRSMLGTANRGDASMPALKLVSVPALAISVELEHRKAHVHETVTANLPDLCGTATQIAAAFTTNDRLDKHIQDVCQEHGAQYQSMGDAVNRWLLSVAGREVMILGAHGVFRNHELSARLTVASGRAQERVANLVHLIKRNGPSREALGQLLNILRDENHDGQILLGESGLSTLLPYASRGRTSLQQTATIVDPLKILADEIASLYLGVPLVTPTT